MSSFSESALEKKLSELSNSQQSVQTLSLWLIHHRKHAGPIVSVWHRELRKAKSNRKLTFLYLANDVIQNSKRKGPEFTREFESVLVDAFSHVARNIPKKPETPIRKDIYTHMFIAAQFTIAKIWKQPKCPSVDEWIRKLWYIYTMEYYAAVKKKELLPFATAWMELESIMLSEISQSMKENHHMISLTHG
uniref:Regulation of nuclear pre-mRNA domain containing 1B n=1 Tax=Myotis myotis TaxID=51298 RepID=A0A7J7W099_MYOMY|nr:regulation of nuclear pre-mRNA domain containing 1B [Myotis myotis]